MIQLKRPSRASVRSHVRAFSSAPRRRNTLRLKPSPGDESQQVLIWPQDKEPESCFSGTELIAVLSLSRYLPSHDLRRMPPPLLHGRGNRGTGRAMRPTRQSRASRHRRYKQGAGLCDLHQGHAGNRSQSWE